MLMFSCGVSDRFTGFAELPSSLTSTRFDRGLPAVIDVKLFAGWQVRQRPQQLPCVSSQQRQPITGVQEQSRRDKNTGLCLTPALD